MPTSLRRVFEAFLALYLTSLTVSIAGMEIFSSLCMLMLVVFWLLKGKLNLKLPSLSTNADYYLLGFWALVCIGVYAIDTVDPTKRVKIIGSLRWILIFYTVKFALSTNYDFLKKYLKFFVGLALTLSTYGIYQALTGFDPIHSSSFAFKPGHWRTRGTFSSVMTYSYVIGMIFCFFLARILLIPKNFESLKKNKFLILATCTLALSLLLTYTRGLWIALLCTSLVMIIYTKRKLFFPVIIALMICAEFGLLFSENFQQRVFTFIQMDQDSNAFRLQLWRANLAMTKDNPIFGVGYRQGPEHIEDYYHKLNISSDFISHAHNNFLSVLSGTGIVGFLLFMGFMVTFYWTGHRLYHKLKPDMLQERALVLGALGAQVCFHVGGMTETNFYDGETMHVFVSTIAVIYAVQYKWNSITTSKSQSA